MRAGRNIFKFKQFEVDQTGCAMRINTDGVLLAASATHQHPKKILDIGTGTGVIALMLAQRFNGAQVDAVEIDFQAAETANGNAARSKFSDQINVFNTAFEDFITNEKYDLIVSNPPFFVNDLKNEEKRKGIARHAAADFFGMLICKSAGLLSASGKICLVLPIKQALEVERLGAEFNLSVSEKIYLHSDKDKPVFRVIICLEAGIPKLEEHHFYIYQSDKVHTEAYHALLKDFFLAF